MRSAFIRLKLKQKCDAAKIKPPEDTGLTLPHGMFKVFACIANIRDKDGNAPRQLWTCAAQRCTVCHRIHAG